MEAFEKWLEGGTKIRLYLRALIEEHPALRSGLFYVWKAGVAHYSQSDLAGDERTRIVGMLKGDSRFTPYAKILIDRIEKGE